MRLFINYLKLHYKSLSMFAAFFAVISAVFFLYNLPFEPVIYAFVLCIIIGIVLLILSFLRFKREHTILNDLKNSIGISLDKLPEPKDIRQQDYNELIKILFDSKRRAESEKAMTISDMTDYYTLWVHQIKTPIAAMRLLLQSNESENTELSEQLFKIEEYVQMVLTYLHCDCDGTDYVIKSCNIDSIIKDSLRKYAKLFIRKKISLNYTPVEFCAITDEKWLGFVIDQLLSNAIKYTKEGSISVYAESPSTLCITDTGIGIAAEDLPRVCEKGYTGYNGRSDKKSTGIGLYLCKRLLEGLSHRLIISSVEGEGTTVKIMLGTVKLKFE